MTISYTHSDAIARFRDSADKTTWLVSDLHNRAAPIQQLQLKYGWIASLTPGTSSTRCGRCWRIPCADVRSYLISSPKSCNCISWFA